MLALGPVSRKQREAYVSASHFHSSSQAAYIADEWLNLIVLRGLTRGRHVPKPVSWGKSQGSPQEDGQMAPSLPAAFSGTCLLDWSRFFTQPSCISQQVVLHISPFSCPRDGGQFLLLWDLSTSCCFAVSPAQRYWGRAIQRCSSSALPLLCL